MKSRKPSKKLGLWVMEYPVEVPEIYCTSDLVFVVFWATWERRWSGRVRYHPGLGSPEACFLFSWLCLIYRLIIMLRVVYILKVHILPSLEWRKNVGFNSWFIFPFCFGRLSEEEMQGFNRSADLICSSTTGGCCCCCGKSQTIKNWQVPNTSSVETLWTSVQLYRGNK